MSLWKNMPAFCTIAVQWYYEFVRDSISCSISFEACLLRNWSLKWRVMDAIGYLRWQRHVIILYLLSVLGLQRRDDLLTTLNINGGKAPIMSLRQYIYFLIIYNDTSHSLLAACTKVQESKGKTLRWKALWLGSIMTFQL